MSAETAATWNPRDSVDDGPIDARFESEMTTAGATPVFMHRATRSFRPYEHEQPLQLGMTEMNQTRKIAALAVSLLAASAHAGTATGTYTQDWSNIQGTYYGSAGQISDAGGQLKLTVNGGSNAYGTWAADGLGLAGPMTKFQASFQFSFYGGSTHSDGFSFLFGNLTDGMNDSGDWGHAPRPNWNGAEWGMNQFSRLGSGLAVGLDRYGSDAGVYGRWGGPNNQIAYTSGPAGNPWTWADAAVAANYNDALQAVNKATMYVDWDGSNGALRVQVAFPGNNAFDVINGTFAQLQGIDTSNFTFGFAGRTGGVSIDTFIDNLNVSYEYSTPVVPGPAGIAALAGLAAVRRRRR